MEFLFEYGLFFAKVATLLVAFVVVVSVVVGASQKNKYGEGRGHLEITPLNQQFEDLKDTMLIATTDESLQKVEEKKLTKAKKKLSSYSPVIQPSFLPSKWNLCPQIQFLA